MDSAQKLRKKVRPKGKTLSYKEFVSDTCGHKLMIEIIENADGAHALLEVERLDCPECQQGTVAFMKTLGVGHREELEESLDRMFDCSAKCPQIGNGFGLEFDRETNKPLFHPSKACASCTEDCAFKGQTDASA